MDGQAAPERGGGGWGVLLLAGCASSVGGDPVESSAIASSSIGSVSDSVEPFDPCTIPKDAVTATGLDVGTERPDFGGITTYPGLEELHLGRWW